MAKPNLEMSLLPEVQKCIEACLNCFKACETCMSADLEYGTGQTMAECVRRCHDCVDICDLTARYMLRNSPGLFPVGQACAALCRACAEECQRHNMPTCQACAVACLECAEQCEAVTRPRAA